MGQRSVNWREIPLTVRMRSRHDAAIDIPRPADLLAGRPPDGRLRLWASMRPGGAGRVDIYASRRGADGRWSPARNVTAINTAAVETAPRFSPDGQVLFFQRQRADGKEEIWWARVVGDS